LRGTNIGDFILIKLDEALQLRRQDDNPRRSRATIRMIGNGSVLQLQRKDNGHR
jgi:hypothetical protein